MTPAVDNSASDEGDPFAFTDDDKNSNNDSSRLDDVLLFEHGRKLPQSHRHFHFMRRVSGPPAVNESAITIPQSAATTLQEQNDLLASVVAAASRSSSSISSSSSSRRPTRSSRAWIHDTALTASFQVTARGIVRQDSECFMIATLQALAHTRAVRNTLDLLPSIVPDSFDLVFRLFVDVERKLLSNTAGNVDLRAFFEAAATNRATRLQARFARGQQDVSDFAVALLERLRRAPAFAGAVSLDGRTADSLRGLWHRSGAR